MATDAANVQVAVTGGIYVDTGGAALPTDASSPLDEAFVELGLISEEGVTESQGTETNDIKAWQNGAVVRRVRTSHALTYAFTALETNPVVLEEFYGNYDAGHVEITGEQPASKAWVIEVFDGEEHHRIVVEEGQVTDIGDVQYVNGEASAYPFTLTGYPVDGVKANIYYDQDGAS